jgi:hypothetical protein
MEWTVKRRYEINVKPYSSCLVLHVCPVVCILYKQSCLVSILIEMLLPQHQIVAKFVQAHVLQPLHVNTQKPHSNVLVSRHAMNAACLSIVLNFVHISYWFSDINECLSGTRVCGENEVCRNKKNGYTCLCRKGFTKENSVCVRKYFNVPDKGSSSGFFVQLNSSFIFLHLSPDLCQSKKNPCPANTTRCEAIEFKFPSWKTHRCVGERNVLSCISYLLSNRISLWIKKRRSSKWTYHFSSVALFDVSMNTSLWD